jgi:hypothetical protein
MKFLSSWIPNGIFSRHHGSAKELFDLRDLRADFLICVIPRLRCASLGITRPERLPGPGRAICGLARR